MSVAEEMFGIRAGKVRKKPAGGRPRGAPSASAAARADGVSRELYLLTGGTTPASLAPTVLAEKPALRRAWARATFTNSARRDGLVFQHWARVGDTNAGGDSPFAKFSRDIRMVRYTDEEYAAVVASLVPLGPTKPLDPPALALPLLTPSGAGTRTPATTTAPAPTPTSALLGTTAGDATSRLAAAFGTPSIGTSIPASSPAYSIATLAGHSGPANSPVPPGAISGMADASGAVHLVPAVVQRPNPRASAAAAAAVALSAAAAAAAAGAASTATEALTSASPAWSHGTNPDPVPSRRAQVISPSPSPSSSDSPAASPSASPLSSPSATPSASPLPSPSPSPCPPSMSPSPSPSDSVMASPSPSPTPTATLQHSRTRREPSPRIQKQAARDRGAGSRITGVNEAPVAPQKDVPTEESSAKKAVHFVPPQKLWTREETDALFDLCYRFDLRFPVIYDRWPATLAPRSIDELKDRYYAVALAVIEHRTKDDKSALTKLPVALQKHCQAITMNPFDYEYECIRKNQLDRQYHRSKAELREEEETVRNARRIEAAQKRAKKERERLAKLLTPAGDILMKAPDGSKVVDAKVAAAAVAAAQPQKVFPHRKVNNGAYARSSMIYQPVSQSSRISKRVDQVLEELKVGTRPTPTSCVVDTFDLLRMDIMSFLELHRTVMRKEEETHQMRLKLAKLKGDPPPAPPGGVILSHKKRKADDPADTGAPAPLFT